MKKVQINVGCDNQGVLAIASDEIENERSKHIDVKYHFIWDNHEEGTVTLNYVPTFKVIADITTRNVPRILYIKSITMLNMKM